MTQVRSEPRIYGKDSPHSYFNDLAIRSLGVRVDSYDDATDRLQRYVAEVDVEMRDRSDEGRYAERMLREVNRHVEDRAASSVSDGAFVTPQYLVEQWVTYRTPDRSFMNQCDSLPLPAYGLTFNIPSFASPGAAAAQAENSGMISANPSGLDLSVALTTQAGAVTISQQLFDRGGFDGQGGAFDSIVIRQAIDQLWSQLDSYLLIQALAGAQAVTNNGTVLSGAAGVAQFYLDLASARNLLSDTAGIKLPGTHVFSTADFCAWVTGQVDDAHRPIVLPDATALSNTANDPGWFGWAGLYLPANLRWFMDDNVYTATPPNSQTTILVGRPRDMLVWEGDLVPFAFPQTRANSLSVALGFREYVAAVPRHAKAFSYITGSAYPTSLN